MGIGFQKGSVLLTVLCLSTTAFGNSINDAYKAAVNRTSDANKSLEAAEKSCVDAQEAVTKWNSLLSGLNAEVTKLQEDQLSKQLTLHSAQDALQSAIRHESQVRGEIAALESEWKALTKNYFDDLKRQIVDLNKPIRETTKQVNAAKKALEKVLRSFFLYPSLPAWEAAIQAATTTYYTLVAQLAELHEMRERLIAALDGPVPNTSELVAYITQLKSQLPFLVQAVTEARNAVSIASREYAKVTADLNAMTQKLTGKSFIPLTPGCDPLLTN